MKGESLHSSIQMPVDTSKVMSCVTACHWLTVCDTGSCTPCQASPHIIQITELDLWNVSAVSVCLEHLKWLNIIFGEIYQIRSVMWYIAYEVHEVQWAIVKNIYLVIHTWILVLNTHFCSFSEPRQPWVPRNLWQKEVWVRLQQLEYLDQLHGFERVYAPPWFPSFGHI